MSRRWTKEEIEFLKDNYGKIPTKDIAEKLGRTIKALTNYANEHNMLMSEEDRHNIWSKCIAEARKALPDMKKESNPNWKGGTI